MDSIRFYGHGVVWDKAKSKRLCEFVKGEFETDDPRTQQILKDAGYLGDYDADDYKLNADIGPAETITEVPAAPGPDFDSMTLDQLKAEADAVGVKYAGNIGKATLTKRLKDTLA